MKRHILSGIVLGLLALLVLGLARAQAPAAFELITTAEAQQEAAAQAAEAARPRVVPRSAPVPRDPGARPAIRVVAPRSADAQVPAPLRIEVAFNAAPGTRIVPESFRVLYGLLKIDLTERLRSHAAISESGVVVERAQVPDGQHRLILQVADDRGNLAEQELRIRVGAAS
ncbi:MAG: hypothetical protein KF683_11915 [Rubrivivax sp.]|nr:hypothetical protein [Rubrivivax sp.]